MAQINDNYLKLAGGYLFPEIARRVRSFIESDPGAADDIIHCGIGDVTEPLPEACRVAMKAAIDEMGDRSSFRGYSDPHGYDFLRDAIARGDFEEHGLPVSAEEIFVSDGSKTDCGAVLDILGADNRIGVPNPVYPVYVDTNVMAGRTGPARGDGSYEGLVYLPCTADNDFVPEIPGEKLDVIYLCYPNNPTGGMITRAKLEAWVEYALKHDAIILYDVAYQAFIRDDTLPRSIYEIDGARRCAMEFHSFSKSAGFTGVRCGYTVCPRELAGTAADGSRVELHGLWSRRWSTKSNCVGYPVQRGAEAVYTPKGREQTAALVSHYLANADILAEGCRARDWTTYGGENAPYVWVRCPDGMDSWGMFDHMLNKTHVVTTPGVGFGSCGEGYLRISAFNSRENVKEVVRRMEAMTVVVSG